MENPKHAFVEYASSRTDEARGKWYTFKPEQNNLGDTYNPSWKSHPNLSNPQSFDNQSNLEGLVSNFMASQDTRLLKFKANFKQQQSEITNKIDTSLKAITDRIVGALLSDTIKNPKLNVNSTSSVLSARSYPTKDPQCSTQIHSSINTIAIHQSNPHNDKPEEEEQEEKDDPENINTNPPHDLIHQFHLSPKKSDDDSHIEEPKVGENVGVGESKASLGMGGKDKTSPGKRDGVQPIEEKKLQKLYLVRRSLKVLRKFH
nr:MAK10-like protein [Tanacetum cinerariifolium]